MTSRRRCAGRNANGEPCGAPPVQGSLFCYFHDPELGEARENALQLGRARKKRDATLAQIYDGFTTLSTTEDKQNYLDIAARDALALDNTVSRVRAMGSLVQTSIKVDEYTEVRQRLDELESIVKAHKDEHSHFDDDKREDERFAEGDP